MKYIVLHCSDSPQGRGDDASTIHKWHKDRGFDGIGYHFVILEDGTVQNGRPIYWTGAHTRGYNEDSIGICMIGRGEYTNVQLDSTMALIADLSSKYPEAKIVGHYELDKHKSCPMYNMNTLRNRINIMYNVNIG